MTLLDDLQRWVLIWLAAALFLAVRHWRAGRNVGLVVGYVVCFGAIDWFASALFLLPWSPALALPLVVEGMRLSAIGMCAFAGGAEIVWWFLRRGGRGADVDLGVLIEDRTINLYLGIGAFMHLVLAPWARYIPSLNAIVGTGSGLATMAIALKCWNAWHERRFSRVWLWLVASCAFPAVTVVTQGYLGYGLSAMLVVVVFIAALYGTRVKVLAGALALGYLGLSVYVTYMRDRTEIRSQVWGGAGLSDRMSTISETITQFEWFDIWSDAHLRRIDDRLNQNWLVGASVMKLASGTASFADGETMWDAVIAIVPRALWPDKPVSAGSGDLVSRFTGLRFQGDTSVGIGQVMECYVNFGTTGVVVGFFIIGGLVMLVDLKSVRALHAGDPGTFLVWFMPGLNLLNVGGSFVDVSASAGACLIVALGLRFVFRSSQRRAPGYEQIGADSDHAREAVR